MIIVKDKTKNSKIYIQRTGGDIIPNKNTDVDLTDYYTKEEVDELVDNVEVDLTGYATEQWVENKGYVTESYTTDEINKLGSSLQAEINKKQPIGDYATTEYVDSEISNKNYVTQEWVEQQGYLTSVPDEYITESELEEELKNIDYSLPTIKVTENQTIEGDIEGVINAVINKEDCNFLWLNGNTLMKASSVYTTDSVTYIRGNFYYTSGDRAVRRMVDVSKTAPYTITVSALQYASVPVDNLTSTSKVLPLSANQGKVLNETKQDALVSGENIKTINGNSLLGSGDINIEGGGSSNIIELTQTEYDALGDNVDADTLYLISDATISANYKTINGESILGEGNIEISGGTTDLSNYYTKSEIDAQIGNINTILENIIG